MVNEFDRRIKKGTGKKERIWKKKRFYRLTGSLIVYYYHSMWMGPNWAWINKWSISSHKIVCSKQNNNNNNNNIYEPEGRSFSALTFKTLCSHWPMSLIVVWRKDWKKKLEKKVSLVKVHLTPNTIFAKLQTWSCSKSNLTFFRNVWISFEQQYNLKFNMLCLMTELVRGMGLFLVWRQKVFCMHVHKELIFLTAVRSSLNVKINLLVCFYASCLAYGWLTWNLNWPIKIQ